MRVRFEFKKEQGARFISHLDMIRVFERSARRAGLQVSYSQGFNPHPKMAFGPALALGVASDREYVDISFDGELDMEVCIQALETSLPPGVHIAAATEVPEGAEALNALINRAEYDICCRLEEGLTQQACDELCTALLQMDEIVIKKRTKKGMQDKDIRKGIFTVKGKVKGDNIFLQTRLLTGAQGSVRPEQVLEVLVSLGLPVRGQYSEIRRTGLFSCNGESCRTPLQVLNLTSRRLPPL